MTRTHFYAFLYHEVEIFIFFGRAKHIVNRYLKDNEEATLFFIQSQHFVILNHVPSDGQRKNQQNATDRRG